MATAREQIAAALKKLGASKPRVIADRTGIDPQALKRELKAALAEGALKAQGATKGRVYALPDQAFAEAEAGGGRGAKTGGKAKKKKGKRRAKQGVRAAQAEGTVAAAPGFIAAITAEMELVIVGEGAPLRLSSAQTLKVAELLAMHFGA
jgi:hypothetical protein